MDQRIFETFKGHARANKIQQDERRKRLARMTPEEAREIFDDLVAGWHSPPDDDTGWMRLKAWRMKTKLAVGSAFWLMAKSKGLI